MQGTRADLWFLTIVIGWGDMAGRENIQPAESHISEFLSEVLCI